MSKNSYFVKLNFITHIKNFSQAKRLGGVPSLGLSSAIARHAPQNPFAAM
ncbi:MAG: hypothetical protein ACYDA9_14160 [Terriglobia bacterium]